MGRDAADLTGQQPGGFCVTASLHHSTVSDVDLTDSFQSRFVRIVMSSM